MLDLTQEFNRDKFFAHFMSESPRVIYFHNGRFYNGIIASIEREDGSGFCFNVSVVNANNRHVIFIRFN